MSAINSNAGATVTTAPRSIVTQTATGSMIDCRNVYKISPTKPVVSVPQHQDMVKIRFTKDESGNGFGYSKTIVTSTQPTEDKNEKTTPQKFKINLAQQPTFQMKTPQNKIVLVKMLPKMPQSGPQFVAAPASRNSISPTTLAVARSVQGLRPIAHVGSPPGLSTVTVLKSVSPEKQKSSANQEMSKTGSDTSISSNSTLTTTTSTDSMTSTSTESDSGKQQMNISKPTDEIDTDKSTGQNSQSTEDTEHNDDHDSSANIKMSREMRCLKASQSSSKILTEFMLNSSSSEKLRKRCRSRGEGDDSRSCGSLTPTSQKRYSVSGREEDDPDDSKGSPSSMKRSGMRSANAEFSMKQKKFLNSIHHQSDGGSDNSDNEGDRPKVKKGVVQIFSPPLAPKLGWDKFCWRCKTCEPGLEACSGCIRCFHPVCLKLSPAFFIVEKNWNCPECIKGDSLVDGANDKPTKDMKLKQDSLIVSLKFTMKRMQQLKGSTILNPLDKEQFPNYDGYVTKHVDLTTLQTNIAEQKYLTTEAFQADVSWMVHNATIYPLNNKLLSIAKGLMKICKQEINEIEACNECYFNANTSKTWFTEVCTKPHLLVWAKLKGFPYWPAKLMSVNVNQLADVRFFGDHDRAWVPIKECFLFCDRDPNTKQHRRTNMAECMREAETYIAKLKKKFGQFNYAELRTPLEMGKLDEHLEAMLPGVLKKIAENGDSQKTKLMLKIIKTADNILSVSPVSPNPPHTSTPVKTKQRESVSPEKIKEVIFGSPKSKSIAESISFEGSSPKNRSQSTQIKEETRNSICTPDPATNPTRFYVTRKRKSISISIDESKLKEQSPESSQELRKKSSRNRSSLANKPKDEDTNSSVSERASTPKCYSSKKRKSSTPVPETVKEPKQSKIESVVLQRESDCWKTVPSGKKTSVASKSSDPECEKQDNSASEPETKNDISVEDSCNNPASKSDEQCTQPPVSVSNSIPAVREIASKPIEGPKSNEAQSSNRLNLLPLVPLAADEIKSEPTDHEEPLSTNEPPVAGVSVEPPTQANTSNSLVSMPANVNDSASKETSLPLLPIKSEPISDDEASTSNANQLVTNQALPPAIQPAENSNQVLIRTSNRITVRNLNQLTNQTAPRANAVYNNNGQPVVLTPVDKSKVPQKITPKAPIIIQAKARKPPLGQLAVSNQNVVTVKRTTTVPGTSGTNSFSVGRTSGGSMMHMVHIPSPLSMANEQGGQQNDTAQQHHPSSTTPSVSSNDPAAAAAVNNSTPQTATSGLSNQSGTTATGASSSAAGRSEEGEHMMAGFITPSLAAAVTETIVSTPPKLHSRPSGALRSEGDCIYPSGAGPVSQILINNSYKMADFFRSVIEDTLSDLSNNSGALEAKYKVLELEIEKLKHYHQQEITKLKHNSDLVLCEMRKNMEVEKTRIINEVRKQCELERIRSVEEAKKKQWCVNCGKEALFYCCWNTSYCDYPCQQQHWATHMSHCTQSQFNLPSNAIASKPSTVINNKLTAAQQHITTPKITTVQTLNMNGRSGLTIQPASQAQQLQQQQLIITSTRGGAQLGKGQPYQRLR
ncbi:MYND-type zinc finger-containing chromatin reader Zmynd8-like isoform X2 [Armigeres subalbatus]|uniref:MYND-type zinc finger-containing chromatin reader Zmynd8-like isoform X2 n=1 Tax=Armigeres subalbatus TaxID=124917 RepID=UPI002ED1107D